MRRTRLTALGLAVLIGFGLLPTASARRQRRDDQRRRPLHGPGQRPPGGRHQRAGRNRRGAPPPGADRPDGGRPTTSAATSSATSTRGGGYTVVPAATHHPESAPVRVLSADEVPPPSLYADQKLPVDNLSATSGYGYLTTRDGTTLSVQVVLPGPADQGPYPTVVEYSGYDPSSPTTGQPQYKLLAPLLGMAWVGVNIRGTGCSGGAYNFFENLQSLDGYDAIETVAAQPWSTGRVGMVGISFAGISQLFVARSRPPHLDAITPLSVIDDTWRGTLYPGGIYNDGFAKGWAEERLDQNKWPNPNAPGWVKTRIAGGDTDCADNMLLRGQNVDLLDQTNRHPFFSALDPQFRYDFPNGGDSLAPQALRQGHHGAGVHRRRVAGRADRRSLGRPAQPVLADHQGPRRRPERRAHRVARSDGPRRDDRVPGLLRGPEGPDDPGDGARSRPRSGPRSPASPG